MKYNPFRPNNIVSPGMFQGRGGEIEKIEKFLFQAANGNPTHFVMLGERGIGKSSLLLLTEHIARGKIKTFDGEKFCFIVASIDIGAATDALSILQEIGRGLRTTLSSIEELKTKTKDFLDWLTRWEVFGVKYTGSQQNFDELEALDGLVRQLVKITKDFDGYAHGILLLIDEADGPDSSAGLGRLCKLFTERLTKHGCSNVIIGLAGLSSILATLKASHESAARLFTIIALDPLLDNEVKSVITTGLNEANKKNKRKTDVDEDAMQLLVSLAEGYPHFIQQFAYSAFDVDEDDAIGVDDVLRGAYEENGALAQLGAKYFNEMYNLKIASDDYRKVLNVMAQSSDGWVARKDIIVASHLKDSVVTNALNAMKGRGIIVADETRKNKGYYRLPTKSFAAWINATIEVKERKDKLKAT